MWALVKSEKNIGFRAAWSHIKSNYRAQLPRILLMVYVFLVIPCHTAIVERGFSLHRIIKNRLRNSMIICTLDSLMRMSLMAPNPINKFDLISAAKIIAKEGLDGKPFNLLVGK